MTKKVCGTCRFFYVKGVLGLGDCLPPLPVWLESSVESHTVRVDDDASDCDCYKKRKDAKWFGLV